MLFHNLLIALSWYREGWLLAATFPFALLHKLGVL